MAETVLEYAPGDHVHSVLRGNMVNSGDTNAVWEDGLEFRVTGPGSLLLFTSPEGTSARNELEGHVRRHYLGLAIRLALAVANISLGLLAT